MPLSIYTCCPKLLHLRLHRVFVGTLESVSLPCLNTMRLEYNRYADEACLELLISSCPLLEDFSFVRKLECGIKVLRVHSKTLTSLSIEKGVYDLDDLPLALSNDAPISVSVLINAPRLKYLNLSDHISECKTISNLGSLTKVNLGVNCDNVPDHFFTSISEVRDMKIFDLTFKDLSNSSMLLRQTRFTVPQCLLSSLEFVDIAGTFPVDMEPVRYFAENSLVLKKLSLRLKPSKAEEVSVALAPVRLSFAKHCNLALLWFCQ